jgi:UDP-glucose 4,6-dehydratase
MRYVVTGGSGFIGSHLVDQLIDDNNEVVVVDSIQNHQNTTYLNKKAKHFIADISDPDILQKIIEQDDILIHLAAQSHVDVSFKKPHKTIFSNVLATHNVMQASLEKKAKKILIMSTDEVYGPTDSISNFNLLNPTNPYSASKAAADMIVNSFKHMHPDLHINTLRSNNIAGPRQFIRNIIPKFSCLSLIGKKMTIHGDGSSQRRYLWVKDAATALIKITERGKSGEIYHTSHPKKYANIDIAKKISTYLQIENNIELIKDRVFNDSTYPFHKNDGIEKILGWSPTKDLDDFLPETIEFYRENIDYYKNFLI